MVKSGKSFRVVVVWGFASRDIMTSGDAEETGVEGFKREGDAVGTPSCSGCRDWVEAFGGG